MTHPTRVLLGTVLLMLLFGSIHAFSVFIEPIELLLIVNRSQVSLIYSLALVSLTLSVLVSHRFLIVFQFAPLELESVLMAVGGLLLTAVSTSLLGYILGYSLLFGSANGIGYNLSLYAVSQTSPSQAGFRMGLVTAAYALGALLFAKIFGFLLRTAPISSTFLTLSSCLIVTAFLVGYLFSDLKRPLKESPSSLSPPSDPAFNQRQSSRNSKLFVQLWLGYGFGVFAGLMAIGHAAGIVSAAGGSSSQIVNGVIYISAETSSVAFWLPSWLISCQNG